jgi:hypothetical protein
MILQSGDHVNAPWSTGSLQTLTLYQLSDFLQRALTTLVSEGLSVNRVHLGTLRSTLLREHDIPEELSDQVIRWFGSIDSDYWEPDLDDMSKMIGLALLSQHKVCPLLYPIDLLSYIAKEWPCRRE